MQKSRLAILLLTFFLGALLLTGSGCDQSDTGLVIDFLNEWAKSKGIMNEKGSPTPAAIGHVLFGASTGDDEADAAIDAGTVVKSIRDADKLTNKANVALNKNPPDRTEALKDLDAAVKLRPNDWYVRNRRSVLLAEMGKAESDNGPDVASVDNACGLDSNSNRDCRAKIYQDRLNLLHESSGRQSTGNSLVSCYTVDEELNNASVLISLYQNDPVRAQPYKEIHARAELMGRKPGVTCKM